ncbi:MAG: hypothetical protein ACHQTE_01250 [Candidatus Saccharimonadales bacterium]
MKQYSDQELELKIHTFLASKQQKYPELVLPRRIVRTVSAPSFSLKLLQSLVSHRSFSTH